MNKPVNSRNRQKGTESESKSLSNIKQKGCMVPSDFIYTSFLDLKGEYKLHMVKVLI